MLEALKAPTLGNSNGRLLIVSTAFITLLLALILASARPAHAMHTSGHYSNYAYDYVSAQTTHAGTYSASRPYVQWSRGYANWWGPTIYRGEYKNTYVYAKRPVGCIYAKVSWHTLTGTIGWPPSGTGSTTSDGFYRKCRASRYDRPSYITLNGVNYASSKLYATTITVCHSSTSTSPKVCSQNKYYN